jgi:DNA polymerase III alpha subunit
MRRLLASRAEAGLYRSVADLLARVRLSREEAENLALAGAMGSLAANRPQALWQVHALLEAMPPQGPLFDYAADLPPCPELEDYGPLKKLQLEQHLLGMTPSAHPMTVYRPLIHVSDGGLMCRTAELPGRAGENVAVAGVLFAERRARTKTGEFMKFISIEDESGVVEAVLLPDAYQRLGARITTRGPYLVTGTVEDHFGALSLMVTDLCLLGPATVRRPAGAGAAGTGTRRANTKG